MCSLVCNSGRDGYTEHNRRTDSRCWRALAGGLGFRAAFAASGKKLDETYKLAWLRGLKTTYYLRTLGATHAEKSTVESGSLNAVPSDGGLAAAAATTAASHVEREAEAPKFCAIDDPTCEACQ